MELVQMLVSQLGVTEDQAKGGAGLLFKIAQEKLLPEELSQIVRLLPEIENLISFAPREDAPPGILWKLTLFFGKKSRNHENHFGLAGGFKKLHMEPDMAEKFISVIVSFAQSKGGNTLKNRLEKVMKQEG